jgi:myo-inositol-1(or 4)-monophosphatase
MSAQHTFQATLRERERWLAIAVTAAEGAASVIRGRGADAAAIEWQEKSPADFVSEVDTAAEETIREVVARDLPGAVVVGEELSPETPISGTLTLLVDPLDGTTNFLHGYPEYAVSIGVLADGEPAAGVVINVPTHDVFTAVSGGGARCNGHSLRVSSITEPARALVGTGFPFKHPRLLKQYQRQFAAVMGRTAGIRRAGSAALDLTDVAAGRFDAFWELVLSPWDFAAGVLLVREAGGVVTNLDGEPPPFTRSPIVAGNPSMHAWILEILRDVERGTRDS